MRKEYSAHAITCFGRISSLYSLQEKYAFNNIKVFLFILFLTGYPWAQHASTFKERGKI